MSYPVLRSIFAKALAIPLTDVTDQVAYNSTPQWDSVAHMALVAALEEQFGIFIDTDDVIDLSNFGKAVDLLRKHGVLDRA
jgi:acyl carrier protein